MTDKDTKDQVDLKQVEVAGRGRPGRRSAEDRERAVLDLLSGKASIDQVARRHGVLPQTVEGWRDEALLAVSAAMKKKPGKSGRERELEKELNSLKSAFTDLAIRHELVTNALSSRPSKPGK